MCCTWVLQVTHFPSNYHVISLHFLKLAITKPSVETVK